MKKRNRDWLLVLPLYAFTLAFVAAPLLYMLVLSFLQRAEVWGVEAAFTLGNYAKMLQPVYRDTFVESVKLALLTTALTLAVGYPFGYFMARLPAKKKSFVMLLVVIPFWTNALMRMYGWMILFRSNGLLEQLLRRLGLIEDSLKLLYNYNAVLAGMVYALLPFMVLAVYSSAEKMDWSLVEAVRDADAVYNAVYLDVPPDHPFRRAGRFTLRRLYENCDATAEKQKRAFFGLVSGHPVSAYVPADPDGGPVFVQRLQDLGGLGRLYAVLV